MVQHVQKVLQKKIQRGGSQMYTVSCKASYTDREEEEKITPKLPIFPPDVHPLKPVFLQLSSNIPNNFTEKSKILEGKENLRQNCICSELYLTNLNEILYI